MCSSDLNLERFRAARRDIECGKMSGAVGNFANIPPFVEEYVCRKLGISYAEVSTQVIQRDRHAYYMATLAVVAATLEQIALEIRNLQRTEVHEVEENFGKGQKGSNTALSQLSFKTSFGVIPESPSAPTSLVKIMGDIPWRNNERTQIGRAHV